MSGQRCYSQSAALEPACRGRLLTETLTEKQCVEFEQGEQTMTDVQRAKEITKSVSARIHEYGSPEVVQVEEAALADPGAGEVLIRIHAAGVNPIDWKIRAGHMQQVMPLPLPFTLGGDLSGIVEAVGPDVMDLNAGDEVYGQAGLINGGTGTFAEFSVAKAGTIAAKP